MMAHTIPPEKLAKQARIMADAGCQCVYVVDSAGALVLEGVRDRVAALVAELGDDAQVGFHGHENLGLGWPIRWRRCEQAPSRSTGPAGASARAPATLRSRR
ncbi:4-hydroxy-2-oxovalerate aldolase [Mycobacterium xenopi 3993]|nr:4-hydroxy-2-oxovalerate aldolase [Mycobacterium xenopi 3993]